MATLFDTQKDFNMIEGEGFRTLSFFLTYPKDKDNPDGDPISKQGDRTMLMPSKDAKPMIGSNGKKYYLKEDLWIRHYQPAAIEKATEHIKKQLMLLKANHNLDFLPFQKKIAIETMIFYFSPLKSFSKKKLESISNGSIIYKETAPDLMDNLPKLLNDCLNKIFIEHDGKIVRGNNIFKCYSMKPGVFIKLKGEL